MKQKNILRIVFAILTLMAVLLNGCKASDDTSVDYQYYSQDQLKTTIENGSSVVILDVQVEEDFDAHHIDGAIATYAFPVKSDEDKAKIDAQFHLVEESDSDIVIVCPKGRVGAERTYIYLLEKGIAAERMFILEGGQDDWTSEMNDTVDTEETNSEDDIEETESSDDTWGA